MATLAASGTSSDDFGAWIYPVKWADPVLTYAFPDNVTDFDYLSGDPLSQLSAAQQASARRALAQVESFTNLGFQESADHAAATLRFVAKADEPTASAYYPNAFDSGGDGFFGPETRDPTPGNYAEFTFIHELGHMLGLEHAHEAAGFGGSALDSTEFTVMSYAAFVGDAHDGYRNETGGFAQSFMQLDIAALQFLYGADHSASGRIWSGDTVYTFDPGTGEMSINGEGQGRPEANRIFRTIWDGHGEDTYDLGNYTTALQLDLRPGAWSTFSQAQLADLDFSSDSAARMARGNLANARLYQGDLRGLIENAIGGTKADEIIGNQGANRLEGRAGRDTILGEAGDDTILGGQHGDTLRGGAGDDLVLGGNGADLLWGDDGADRLKGLNGNDDLRGGKGADVLIGGAGQDILRGHAGADVFMFMKVSDSAEAAGYDRILDAVSGRDVLDFSSVANNLTLSIGGGLVAGSRTLATRERDGNTIISVDIDRDGAADMKVLALDVTGLTESDFLI
ncbi:M10 family metallopeptidase [Marinibacterium sp. SX1]|uniref:M10 family metallopeptidase n=1 Tax=Marinibacterium sp. SX1 TaxID=3388424 RepID=UPI003D16C81F